MKLPWKKDTTLDIEPGDLDWENVEVHEGHPVKALRRGPNIATYNLQVFAPNKVYENAEEMPHVYEESELDKRVLADLPAVLEDAEVAIEGMLPEGYRVIITEWNR